MKIETFCVGMVRTNCYLVYDEESHNAFLIDPGDSAEQILNRISELSLYLRYIVLTHGHFDHVLAVPQILQKTNAKLIASKHEDIGDAEACGFNTFRQSRFTPLVADYVVGDKDILQVGNMKLQFMETPGHTTGSMCILVDDTIFTGDTLFAGSCGRCDLPGGSFELMLKSLKKLSELPGEYQILPGHEGRSTLLHEKRSNPYMREAVSQ